MTVIVRTLCIREYHWLNPRWHSNGTYAVHSWNHSRFACSSRDRSMDEVLRVKIDVDYEHIYSRVQSTRISTIETIRRTMSIMSCSFAWVLSHLYWCERTTKDELSNKLWLAKCASHLDKSHEHWTFYMTLSSACLVHYASDLNHCAILIYVTLLDMRLSIIYSYSFSNCNYFCIDR
jgi:hypothetical protein